jgi:hypothetical protein
MLTLCCYPTNSGSNRGEERIQQYVKGLVKFFEYNDVLKKHDVDIYVVDNSIKDGDSLPQDILAILPDNVKINTCFKNEFGSKNKGAGLIEQWLYCKDIIEKYDWFIHFEPRQLLLNFNFINDFLEKPRNLFKTSIVTSFYTGIFAIETKVLLKFSNAIYLHEMCRLSKSIEYILYDYFIHFEIPFDHREKIELEWHDVAANQLFSL